MMLTLMVAERVVDMEEVVVVQQDQQAAEEW